jgi:hypothetical protein
LCGGEVQVLGCLVVVVVGVMVVDVAKVRVPAAERQVMQEAAAGPPVFVGLGGEIGRGSLGRSSDGSDGSV